MKKLFSRFQKLTLGLVFFGFLGFLNFETANAQIDVDIDARGGVRIGGDVAGVDFGFIKDECGIDFGGDVGELLELLSSIGGEAIGDVSQLQKILNTLGEDVIGRVSVKNLGGDIDKCLSNGLYTPNGGFRIDDLRDRFLQKTKVDGQIVPLCKIDEEGQIFPSGQTISEQTGGEYEIAVNPLTPTVADQTNCVVDYGVTNTTNVRDFVVQVINWALTFLGLLALIAVIYGGYMYLLYYGDDNRTATGRKIIGYAIVGIIIVLLAYAIVNTVIRALSGFQDGESGAFSSTSTSVSTQAGTVQTVGFGVAPAAGNQGQLYSYGSGVWVSEQTARDGLEFSLDIVDGIEFNQLSWTWGDSTSDTLPGLGGSVPFGAEPITHSYQKPKPYRVGVRGRTTENVSIKGDINVRVGGVKANLTSNKTKILAGGSITFDAGSSYTPVGSISQYYFDCYVIEDQAQAACPAQIQDQFSDKAIQNVVFEDEGTYEVWVGVATSFSGDGTLDESKILQIEVVSSELIAEQVVPAAKTPNGQKNTEYLLDASPSLNLQKTRGGMTYTWDIYDENGTKIDQIITSSARTAYDFKQKGDYTVSLTTSQVFDGEEYLSDTAQNGFGNCPEPACQTIEITSTLGLDFATQPSYQIGNVYEFTTQVLFGGNISDFESLEWSVNAESVQPTPDQDPAYEFVINAKEKADVVFYAGGGPYYLTLTGTTTDGETASVTKPIFVQYAGSGGVGFNPLAVISVNVDGQEQILIDNWVAVTRDQTITLDSTKSINSDGTIWDENKTKIDWTVAGEPISFGEYPDGGVNDVIEVSGSSDLGNTDIKLIVTDRKNSTARDERVIAIKIMNKAPEFVGNSPVSWDVINNEDEARVTVTANAKDEDTITSDFADGKIKTFKFELLEDGIVKETQILDSDEAEFDLSGYRGVHKFDVRVTVTDFDGESANFIKYNAFEIEIEVENLPPSLKIFTNKSFGDTDVPFAFQSNVVDPENDFVEIEWDFDCNNVYPGEEPKSAAPTPQFRYPYLEDGNYPYTVTVCATATDGIEDTDRPVKKEIEIIVDKGDNIDAGGNPLGNFPPVVKLDGVTPAESWVGPKKYRAVGPGARFSFIGNVTDPNPNDTHDLTWIIAGPESFEEMRQTPALVYSFDLPGTYTVTLKAKENNTDELEEAEDVIEIEIVTPEQAENTPPIVEITSVSDLSARVGDWIMISKFGMDAEDGQDIDYAWDFADGEGIVNEVSNDVKVSFDSEGEKTVSVTATDRDGESSEVAEVMITIGEKIEPIKTEPKVKITQVSPESGLTSDRFSFYATASDLDGDDLTYVWIIDGEEIETDVPVVSHYFESEGTKRITLKVTDEDENVASDEAEVEVFESQTGSPADNAPEVMINAINPANIKSIQPEGYGQVGNLFQVFAVGTDQDLNDELVYAWDMGDGTNFNTEIAAVSHFYEASGEYTVSVTATDLAGQSATATASVVVLTPEQIEQKTGVEIYFVEPENNKSVDTLIRFYSQSFTPDNLRFSYAWDMGDGTTYFTPQVTHRYAEPGSYTATITATDGQEEYSDSVTIEVGTSPERAENNPNVNILGALDGAQYQLGKSVRINAFASDMDGDPIVYRWDMGDGTTYDGKFVNHDYKKSGNYSIKVTAEDPNGNTAEDLLDVIILDKEETENQPPIGKINQTAPNGEGKVGDRYAFWAYGADNDGDALTYKWDMGDGTTYGTSAVQHLYSAAGNYTVLLEITDGIATTTTQKQITVNENPLAPDQPPLVSISAVLPDTTVLAGSLVGFQAFGIDPEGNSLTAAWDFGDGGTSNQNHPTYSFENPGDYTVTLTGSDGALESTDEVKIKVVESADDLPPATPRAKINNISPKRTHVGDSVEFYSSVAYFAGGKVAYSWDFGDGSGATTAAARHIYSQAGDYTITLTVTDGIETKTDTASVTITKNPESPDGGEGAGSGASSSASGNSSATSGANSSSSATGLAGGGNFDPSDPKTYPKNLPNNPQTGNVAPNVTISSVFPSTSVTTLDAVSFFVSGGDINNDELTYTWQFPDGIQYRVPNVVHRFAESGEFRVKVLVDDGEFETSDEIVISVREPNQNEIEKDKIKAGSIGGVSVLPEACGFVLGKSAVGALASNNSPRSDLTDENTKVANPNQPQNSKSKEKQALQKERESLMTALPLTRDPMKRKEVRDRVDEIDKALALNQTDGKLVAESQKLLLEIQKTYNKEIAAQKLEIEKLVAVTDNQIDKQKLQDCADALAQLQIESEKSPEALTRALGIALTDGVVPHVTISGTVDTTFFLYGTAPADSDAAIGFGWDFGNGQTATGQNAQVRYAAPGYYRVLYTLTDGVATAQDVVIIKVEPSGGVLR